MQTIEIAKITPNADQPRKHFEQTALDELAQSIARLGVLQAIVVRPAGDGTFQIVAGERRWRASRQAGLTEIPAVIVDTDGTDQFVRSVAENVNRRDMTAMEEAHAYQRLVESGMTVEEISDVLGKRVQDVRWRLDLLGLDPALHKLADRSINLAWTLAKLNTNDQFRVWREINAGMSDREAIEFAEALAAPQSEMFDLDGFTLSAEEIETRSKVERKLDALDRQIAQLHDLLDASPETLAAVHQDRTAQLAERLDLATKQLRTLTKQANTALGTYRALT